MKITHIAAALAAFLIFASMPGQGTAGERPVMLAQASHDLMSQAATAMNAKDYDEAIRLLERANQANPFDDSVKGMLGKAFRARGWTKYSGEDFEDGIVDFRRANSYEPKKNHETYLGLGYGSFRLRNYDDALYYLYDAVYIDPDDPNGHELIGNIYYQRGRLGEAIDEWDTALGLQPDNEALKRMLDKARREHEVEGRFSSNETYYFNIKYEGEERRDLGALVLEVLDAAHRDVGGDLDYFPNEVVTVILYTQKQFSDITDAPTWSSGVFDGSIRIPVGGEVDREALSTILYHEYAHAVVSMVAGRALPTWLNEGVALYEERWVRDRYTGMGPGRIVPLSDLEGPFVGISDPQQARDAYMQSLSAVRFFAERFGQYNLAKLVRMLGGGVRLADAMQQCTGISLQDFERYWLAGVSR